MMGVLWVREPLIYVLQGLFNKGYDRERDTSFSGMHS